jgi:GDPmannose 4,6-dehydratase
VPEYVEAMWLMLEADKADDFVIATGQSNSLKDFVAQAFACYGLDWTEHVVHDDQLMRPNENAWSQGNPAKAKKLLGWQATKKMNDVVKILCGV